MTFGPASAAAASLAWERRSRHGPAGAAVEVLEVPDMMPCAAGLRPGGRSALRALGRQACPALEERRLAPAGDGTACHACAQPRHAAIAAVKTIHTLAWLSIESCVIYTPVRRVRGPYRQARRRRCRRRCRRGTPLRGKRVPLPADRAGRAPGRPERLGDRHLPAEMARAQPAGNPRTASGPDGVPARTEPAAVALSSTPDWLICICAGAERSTQLGTPIRQGGCG